MKWKNIYDIYLFIIMYILFSRRQLSLHIDLEHKFHEKYSKFHSCAGIVNRSNNDTTIKSDIEPTTSSNETLTYDPSTNIIYYTSTESLVKSVHSRKGNGNETFLYKWEPETNIIRVWLFFCFVLVTFCLNIYFGKCLWTFLLLWLVWYLNRDRWNSHRNIACV